MGMASRSKRVAAVSTIVFLLCVAPPVHARLLLDGAERMGPSSVGRVVAQSPVTAVLPRRRAPDAAVVGEGASGAGWVSRVDARMLGSEPSPGVGH